MSVTEIAVAWAKAMAADDAHGYDQTSRWGPDYDCSSLVISAFKKAGLPLTCTYTGNMKADMLAHGFRDVTREINLRTGAGLQSGDVLLHEAKHTALYVGNGKVVNAGGNELGKAAGGKTGDQTGREIALMGYYDFPWERVLRYEDPSSDTPHQSPAATASTPLSVGSADISPRRGESSPQGEAFAGGASPAPAGTTETYTVKSGDSLWGIAERVLGNGFLYEEIRKLNGLDGYRIYPGQVLKLPGGPSSDTPHQSPAATASTPLSVGSADISPRRGESSPQGEAFAGGASPAPADTTERESVTVALKKTVLEKMKKTAERKGITLSELIEGAFK